MENKIRFNLYKKIIIPEFFLDYIEKILQDQNDDLELKIINDFISGKLVNKIKLNEMNDEEEKFIEILYNIHNLIRDNQSNLNSLILTWQIMRLIYSDKSIDLHKDEKYKEDFETVLSVLIEKHEIILLKSVLERYLMPKLFYKIEEKDKSVFLEMMKFIYDNRLTLLRNERFEKYLVPSDLILEKIITEFDYYRVCRFFNDYSYLLLEKDKYVNFNEKYVVPDSFGKIDQLEESKYLDFSEYIKDNEERLLTSERFRELCNTGLIFKLKNINLYKKLSNISKMDKNQYKSLIKFLQNENIKVSDKRIKIEFIEKLKKNIDLKLKNKFKNNLKSKIDNNYKIDNIVKNQEKILTMMDKSLNTWEKQMENIVVKDKGEASPYYVSLANYLLKNVDDIPDEILEALIENGNLKDKDSIDKLNDLINKTQKINLKLEIIKKRYENKSKNL